MSTPLDGAVATPRKSSLPASITTPVPTSPAMSRVASVRNRLPVIVAPLPAAPPTTVADGLARASGDAARGRDAGLGAAKGQPLVDDDAAREGSRTDLHHLAGGGRGDGGGDGRARGTRGAAIVGDVRASSGNVAIG